MRNILILLSIALISFACNRTTRKTSGDFSLEGKFKNAGNTSVQIEELTTQDLIFIDEIMTDENGNFSFTYSMEEAGFYIVRLNEKNFITLLIEPGEYVRLSGDATQNPSEWKIQGSPGSEKLAYLNNSISTNFSQVESLAQRFRERRHDPDFQKFRQQLDLEYTRIYQSQQKLVKDFISDNPRSLASVIALYKYFGNQLLLNENEHFEYFENLSQTLSDKYPDNKHVMALKRRVNEHRRNQMQRQLADANLEIGKVAPEIILPDTEGNPVALSSLRGNVVLIDFWAAWCAPCRKINSRLENIYSKYNHLGFEIYGISLDRTREQWIAGISEDQISWVQVSDLRFWNSPVINLYNVEGIPYAVLIDQEGRIVAKGVDINQLEDLLVDLLR